MTASLFFDPQARPLSNSGATLPEAYLKFYLTGTTTAANVYSDASLDTSLGATVTADSDGRFDPFYLDASITYRVQQYDASDVLIWDVDPYMPPRDYLPGTVIWFYGTVEQRDDAYPSSLWAVLDGNNGTPDGLGRVPLIAGGDFTIGDTGGNVSATTSEAGAHDHTGDTGETVLTSDNMPVHTHDLFAFNTTSVDGRVDGFALAANDVSVAGERNAGGAYITDNGKGTQIIKDTGTADPDGHTHTISEEAAHTHTVATMPPYIVLWALMRKYP